MIKSLAASRGAFGSAQFLASFSAISAPFGLKLADS
jgi:hypothetical protein